MPLLHILLLCFHSTVSEIYDESHAVLSTLIQGSRKHYHDSQGGHTPVEQPRLSINSETYTTNMDLNDKDLKSKLLRQLYKMIPFLIKKKTK